MSYSPLPAEGARLGAAAADAGVDGAEAHAGAQARRDQRPRGVAADQERERRAQRAAGGDRRRAGNGAPQVACAGTGRRLKMQALQEREVRTRLHAYTEIPAHQYPPQTHQTQIGAHMQTDRLRTTV